MIVIVAHYCSGLVGFISPFLVEYILPNPVGLLYPHAALLKDCDSQVLTFDQILSILDVAEIEIGIVKPS